MCPSARFADESSRINLEDYTDFRCSRKGADDGQGLTAAPMLPYRDSIMSLIMVRTPAT